MNKKNVENELCQPNSYEFDYSYKGESTLGKLFDMNQRKYEALEKYMFELKDRIDKAVEYIENELEWDMPSLEVCDMKIILDILKGDSNE